MSDYTPKVTGTGARATVQRFGGFLAGMVMPNIAAFIAWGLITALFIKTGWLPVPQLGGFPDENGTEYPGLVGPMITYLLPLLIGFTGGRMVHGNRGGVVGAVATMGVVVGAEMPMFLGAMIMGPAAAWVIKKLDGLFTDKVKPGFEMLIDNFTAGIVGMVMAIVGFFGIGPIARGIMGAAEAGVGFLVENGLLPLASIFIEPGKVLFLNNAINHGVLTPLGATQSEEAGKSIVFMLESNPGPGLGILLAIMFFGPRILRASTPAAVVIHFFGGIHEIYFPYILMKPRLILAAIAGGMAGIATFLATGSGLVASPSPGSIFAYMAMTPRGGHLGVLLGVAVAAGISFVVAAALLKFGRGEKAENDETATDTADGAPSDAAAAASHSQAAARNTRG